MDSENREIVPPVAVGRRPDRAEHVGGVLWLVFGAAAFYGSWTMDRLESQNINPVTAPGLLPGLIGIGIVAFALVLLLRRKAPPTATFANDAHVGNEGAIAQEPLADWKRLTWSWVLCCGFAGLSLGRGLPFWLLAGVFVFLHILTLDDPDRVASQSLAKRAGTAAVIAVCTAAVVTIVFQNFFFVLPRTEPAVAIPMAWPAWPFRASAWPSIQAAAFAAVPGMFSRMAVRLPP